MSRELIQCCYSIISISSPHRLTLLQGQSVEQRASSSAPTASSASAVLMLHLYKLTDWLSKELCNIPRHYHHKHHRQCVISRQNHFISTVSIIISKLASEADERHDNRPQGKSAALSGQTQGWKTPGEQVRVIVSLQCFDTVGWATGRASSL